MAEQFLGASGGRRRRRSLAWLSIAGLLAVSLTLWFAIGAGAVVEESGFEDDDGNLVVNDTTTPLFDWNGFDPTWTGTPLRTGTATHAPWEFTGLEDLAVSTSDSGFVGGTKQDTECPGVGTQKANNKEDLERAYFASGTVNGHVYLNLAWVRIPQNNTSASSNVMFEFNQGDVPCGAGSDDLVERTPGDLLVLYDFAGGTAEPIIQLSEWTETAGDTCEVGSISPPCWGVAATLGPGVAEAEVNAGPVTDEIAPDGTETLGTAEFGEAGIDLTDALDLEPNACIAFGRGYAVSRTSGNSATAQMKDLVGPGEVDIRNCGQVIIRKQTDPDEDPNVTSFSYTTTGSLDPAAFNLMDDGVQDYGAEVQAGSYSVTESDPGPNYALTALDCSASDTANGTTIMTDLMTRTVSFNLAAEDTVDCTFTNTLQQGAFRILKNSTKGGPVSQAGAVFSYDGSTVTDNGATDGDPDIGEVCVSGLLPGDYDVTETSAPPGYGLPVDPGPETVTVVSGTNCTDNPPTGTAVVTFTDPPLADIQVNFRDGGSGETSATSIVCDNTGTTPDTTPATGWDDSVTHTGIRIDPSPRTITCTIVIDP